jgi:transposase-like protein
VLDEGKSVGSVARHLDLTEPALRDWVKRARADRTQGKTASRPPSVRGAPACGKRTGFCGKSGRS